MDDVCERRKIGGRDRVNPLGADDLEVVGLAVDGVGFVKRPDKVAILVDEDFGVLEFVVLGDGLCFGDVSDRSILCRGVGSTLLVVLEEFERGRGGWEDCCTASGRS